MHHMLCRHHVQNFERWKRVFDADASAQRRAGLRVLNVWRDVDDPGNVFMLFAVDDLEQARAFVTSPSVPDAQRDSGVLEIPEIHFLEPGRG